MGFIRANSVGRWVVFFLDTATEDGWSFWTDPVSGQTRVWDCTCPTLLANGLLSDDWDRSFREQYEALEYVQSLT